MSAAGSSFLPGLATPCGSIGVTQAAHAVEIRGAVHLAEKGALLEADAVLAGDRSAEADAQAEDLGGQDFGAIVRACLTAIVEDQRVQVAVAGMEHVGDADAVCARHALRSPPAPRRGARAARRRPGR